MSAFDYWWEALVQRAGRFRWPLGKRDSYREYFEDGDSPAQTLDLEMAAAARNRRPAAREQEAR